MRKYITPTLTAIIAVTPIVSVVSCSKKSAPVDKEYIVKKIQNNSSYIDQETVDILSSKLLDTFKENSYLLKKVVIYDGEANDNEGEFDKQVDKIFFNTYQLKKMYFKNKNNIAEYIHQIIYHEYNHFLNTMFLNDVSDKDNTLDLSVYYETEKGRVPERWNKDFLSKFKEILKYNVDTKLYSSNLINDEWVSLGSKYNQKDLYELANSQAEPKYEKLEGNEVMSPLEPDKYLPLDKHHIIRGTSLEYLYTTQELVARKMQVANMKYKAQGDSKEFFDQNGWIHNGYKVSWSPYLQDVVNYKKNITSKDAPYLYDVPTSELTDLYNQFVHSDFGINHIAYENDFEQKNNSYEGEFDTNKIIFSGILENKTEISYLKNDKYISIPTTWIKVKKGWAYHLSNYIKVSDILNCPLVFKSGDEWKPLGFKNPDKGLITTYRDTKKTTNDLVVKSLDKKTLISAL